MAIITSLGVMYIRDAVETDLGSIVKIYNQSIPDRMATADTQPVTVGDRPKSSTTVNNSTGLGFCPQSTQP